MARKLRFLKTLGHGLFFHAPTGFITGLLYSSGFPTVWGWHWSLSWFGLAILLIVLRYCKPQSAIFFSFSFGLGFFLSIYIWVTASVQWWIPWVALAILQSLIWLGWCICASLSRKITPPLWALVVAFTFSGFEQLRGNYPWGGSPWGYLAYAQVENHFSQLAPWIGESGIAFLIVWVLAAVISSFDRNKSTGYNIPLLRYCSCILPAIVVCVMSFGGFIPKPSIQTNSSFPELKIAAVQGNITKDFQTAYRQPFLLLDNHIRETEKNNIATADLVVWGEQSADIDPRQNRQAQERMESLLRKTRKPLFYGSVTDINGITNNHYVLLDSRSRVKQSYQKKHLVPFGEYLPQRKFWESFIPQVQTLLPRDIHPGNKTGIFDLKQVGIPVRVGVNICFEEAISKLVRENVYRGAEILIFPTNNASFSSWAESLQQLQISRFRALEYQRFIVQISINGVSAIVDNDGKILVRTALFEPDLLQASLTPQTALTFSARFGNYQEMTFLWGSVILFTAILFFPFFSYKKFRK